MEEEKNIALLPITSAFELFELLNSNYQSIEKDMNNKSEGLKKNLLGVSRPSFICFELQTLQKYFGN